MGGGHAKEERDYRSAQLREPTPFDPQLEPGERIEIWSSNRTERDISGTLEGLIVILLPALWFAAHFHSAYLTLFFVAASVAAIAFVYPRLRPPPERPSAALTERGELLRLNTSVRFEVATWTHLRVAEKRGSGTLSVRLEHTAEPIEHFVFEENFWEMYEAIDRHRPRTRIATSEDPERGSGWNPKVLSRILRDGERVLLRGVRFVITNERIMIWPLDISGFIELDGRAIDSVRAQKVDGDGRLNVVTRTKNGSVPVHFELRAQESQLAQAVAQIQALAEAGGKL